MKFPLEVTLDRGFHITKLIAMYHKKISSLHKNWSFAAPNFVIAVFHFFDH